MGKRKPWSPVEDTYLISNFGILSQTRIAKNLGRNNKDVKSRANYLGLYANKARPRVCANPVCGKVFNTRTSKSYCSKECSYTLSRVGRPFKKDLKSLLESAKSISKAAKSLNVSDAVMFNWLKSYKMLPSTSFDPTLFVAKSTGEKGKSTSGGLHPVKFKSGFREDIGISVRSSWEHNVILYLNHRKIAWEYEPKTFYFNEIKRGTTSYLPDIKINPKSKSYKWIEVKGYLDSRSKTKIRRFKKYYPEEFARLTAITKNSNVQATKFFQEMEVPIYAYYDDLTKKFGNKIKGWE